MFLYMYIEQTEGPRLTLFCFFVTVKTQKYRGSFLRSLQKFLKLLFSESIHTEEVNSALEEN